MPSQIVPPPSAYEWLSKHLRPDYRRALTQEYLHFVDEGTVMRRFNERERGRKVRDLNSVLRGIFPFSVSKHGEEYWLQVCESYKKPIRPWPRVSKRDANARTA